MAPRTNAADSVLAARRSFGCQSTPDDAVERYLAGLGLVDLQIRQLNEIIDSTPTNRTARAKRLVNLYIDELVTDTDDEPRRARLFTEINLLLKKTPSARTALTAVMLCVAEQQKAETNAERWLNDPQDQESLQAATRTLRSVIPRLQQHRGTLQTELKQLDLQMENLEEGKLLEEKEKEYLRKEAVLNVQISFSASVTITWGSRRAGASKRQATERPVVFFASSS